MTKLEELFRACSEKNFPFAVFQFPGEKTYHYTIQLSTAQKIHSIEDITALTGFVFAPFQEKNFCPSLIIKPDISGIQDEPIFQSLKTIRESTAAAITYHGLSNVHEASKEEYMHHVTNIRDKIKHGDFRKAILSRVIIRPQIGLLTDIFHMMCQKYHYSFISMVSIPGLGCWIGASPELLFSRKNGEITLVALAGTQAKSNNNTLDVIWDEKEITEQNIVSEYLKNLLKDFDVQQYNQKGPETIQAGEVLHIKTIFTIPENSMAEQTGKFIKKLHPTPAVWGQPKTEALNVIKTLEGYEREYYAGFLGPIIKNGTINLYVNLRTMKAMDDKLMIYVGSGITDESIPEKEWEETCMKAMTLQSIINKQ